MSWFKTFFEEIKRIFKIENNEERLENYDQLVSNLIEKPKIKKMKRGYNWIYFYLLLGYGEDGNEILGEQLGKIHKDIFKENKKEIEMLRKTGKIEELKKYFKK